jgi:type III secretion protein R
MPALPNLPDPVYVFGLIIVLGLVPFFAVLATSYTKIVIVLGLMRLALGTQQVPPNMVMNAMAIILTVFVMAPVGTQVSDIAQKELTGSKQRFDDLVSAAKASAEPLRAFLVKNTREREKLLFLKAAGDLWPANQAASARNNDLLILIPSFTLSEVIQAFQIGFLLYLVFTVIDLLVSAVLLSMGMSMVSPVTVSIPFKLLLFVALDGWSRLVQSLLLTYR